MLQRRWLQRAKIYDNHKKTSRSKNQKMDVFCDSWSSDVKILGHFRLTTFMSFGRVGQRRMLECKRALPEMKK